MKTLPCRLPAWLPTFLAYSCFIGHGSFFNALSRTTHAEPSINEAIKVTKIDTNHARLPSKRVAAHSLGMCTPNRGRGGAKGWSYVAPARRGGLGVVLSCIRLAIIYRSAAKTAHLLLWRDQCCHKQCCISNNKYKKCTHSCDYKKKIPNTSNTYKLSIIFHSPSPAKLLTSFSTIKYGNNLIKIFIHIESCLAPAILGVKP